MQLTNDINDRTSIFTPGQASLFVWSIARRLAHLPSCCWAEKISEENRMIGTNRQALRSCRRPCRVCRPVLVEAETVEEVGRD